MNNNKDHLFFDLDAIRKDTIDGYVPFTFSETRTIPILQNPEDYYLSVVRMQLDTSLLPISIAYAQLGQANPNILEHSVSMSYILNNNTYTYTQNLIYIPELQNQPTPAAPLVAQDFSSLYYYIYTYQHYVKLINNALLLCHQGLRNIVNNITPGTIPSNANIFLEYDPQQKLSILNADISQYDEFALSYIKVHVNQSLYRCFFTSMPANLISLSSSTELNYKINIYSSNGSNILTVNNVNYYQMYQEQSSSSLFNCVSSIVLQSNILPVRSTQTSDAKRIDSNSGLTYNSNSNNANIITDYEIYAEGLDQYTPSILYIPTAQFRLVDLTGNNPFYSLNIQVMWKDYFSNLFPLYIPNNGYGNLKIMFIRKDAPKM